MTEESNPSLGIYVLHCSLRRDNDNKAGDIYIGLRICVDRDACISMDREINRLGLEMHKPKYPGLKTHISYLLSLASA